MFPPSPTPTHIHILQIESIAIIGFDYVNRKLLIVRFIYVRPFFFSQPRNSAACKYMFVWKNRLCNLQPANCSLCNYRPSLLQHHTCGQCSDFSKRGLPQQLHLYAQCTAIAPAKKRQFNELEKWKMTLIKWRAARISCHFRFSEYFICAAIAILKRKNGEHIGFFFWHVETVVIELRAIAFLLGIAFDWGLKHLRRSSAGWWVLWRPEVKHQYSWHDENCSGGGGRVILTQKHRTQNTRMDAQRQ